MNKQNLDKWVQTLRTTTRPQARNFMAGFEDGVRPSKGVDAEKLGLCCLGIGQSLCNPEWDELDAYLSDDALPTSKFVRWLGLELPEEAGIDDDESMGYDLVIDWPDELWPANFSSSRDVTASQLNDRFKLSFTQIADLVEYFGVREAALG